MNKAIWQWWRAAFSKLFRVLWSGQIHVNKVSNSTGGSELSGCHLLLGALSSGTDGELWFLKPSMTHGVRVLLTCPCWWMRLLLTLPHCLGDRTRNANGRNVPSHCLVLQVLHQICLPFSKYPSWALKLAQPSLDCLKLLNFFCK